MANNRVYVRQRTDGECAYKEYLKLLFEGMSRLGIEGGQDDFEIFLEAPPDAEHGDTT